MDSSSNSKETEIEKFLKIAVKLLKEYPRITPALLCRKLKVDMQTAQRLCDLAYLDQCREFYYQRRFGMSYEEFEKMCQNEVEITTKNMGLN